VDGTAKHLWIHFAVCRWGGARRGSRRRRGGYELLGTGAGRYTVIIVLVTGIWTFATGLLVSLRAAASDLGVIRLVTLIVYFSLPQSPKRAVYAGLLALAGAGCKRCWLWPCGSSIATFPNAARSVNCSWNLPVPRRSERRLGSLLPPARNAPGHRCRLPPSIVAALWKAIGIVCHRWACAPRPQRVRSATFADVPPSLVAATQTCHYLIHSVRTSKAGE